MDKVFTKTHAHIQRPPCFALCSVHSQESCYYQPQSFEATTGIAWRGNLVQGSIPTKDSVNFDSPKKLTSRSKQQVGR